MKTLFPTTRSLRFRLVALYLALIVSATAALGVQVYRWSANDLLSERRVRLLTEARIVADTIAPRVQEGANNVAISLDTLGRRFGSRLLYIDPQGTVQADSLGLSAPEEALTGTEFQLDEVASALEGSESAAVYRLHSGAHVLYATAPVVRAGEVIGAVLVSGSLQELVSSLNQLARRLMLGGLGVTAVFLLATWLVSSRLTSPLRQLTAAARKLGIGELNTRVEVRSQDEVGELAHTFNRMAEQLQEHDLAQRRFLSDVSHELRSPVSSSLMLVEALDAQSSRNAELVERLGEQLDRMSRLVAQLLELARLEEWQAENADLGAPRPRNTTDPREPALNYANVAHVTSRVYRRLRPLAEAQGVRLERSFDGEPLVTGSEESLERILQNLVENGIKYTESGGRVTVGATALVSDNLVELQITDTGEGIDPDALPHIFERFFRADQSRSRERGGFGLGLAIVRRRVESMGGQISVTSQPGEGTQFIVRLPLFKR